MVLKDLGKGTRVGNGMPSREKEVKTVLQTKKPRSLAAQEVWKRREQSVGPGWKWASEQECQAKHFISLQPVS